MRTERRPNLWKGFFAGTLGGLAGVFVMGRFHSLLVPNPQSPLDDDATVRVASAISRVAFDHVLTPQEKEMAGPVVDYAFGAGVAAVYGALVELAEPIRVGYGLAFAVAVWLGAHVITVPALGLSQPVTQSDARSEAIELEAHLIYGAVVEGLRRAIRGYIIR